ncbi:MAG: hypothetical protein R3C59_04455 [Planctomycetaceae bacterium]
MTDEPEPDATPPDSEPNVTDVNLSYAAPSRLTADDGKAQLSLFGNLHRDPVRFDATVKDPLKLREALLAMHQIVGADFRYVPKDRTAFLAYQRLKRESANLNAWQAQQAYFSWLMRNDPLAFLILDPVITVHPDNVMLEVFSKDEGAYACLSVAPEAFNIEGTPTCGTTNIDFSKALADGVLQMRGYRETRLSIGQESTSVKTQGAADVLEKQIKVPDSWLRGFLQVQSAAALPRDSFHLRAIDLYNVFRYLRMHADVKGQRRGLRVELVPGERPVLILEPWETVIASSAGVYQGSQAKVVRIWGRRRLMLLRRILPMIDTVDVHVLGTGLPSFWVLRGPQLTMTLGMTGFTSANWSQAAAFDLLLPRKTQTSKELESVVKFLAKSWSADEAELTKGTKLKGSDLIEALQLGCQQGQLMYDVAASRYRLRPLSNVPLDMEKLEYRNGNERLAHDLIARKAAVSISQENHIFGTGVELTGKVEVAEDKRDYRPQLLLTDDGFVTKTECTCTRYRQQGLKAGPCPHLIALRLAYAEIEKKRKESSRSRNAITVETKTYSRRRTAGEEVYQITLDKKKVRLRWGPAGQDQRQQQLHFNSVDDARTDYLQRVDQLVQQGFLDASA